jgi:hypothetical protein
MCKSPASQTSCVQAFASLNAVRKVLHRGGRVTAALVTDSEQIAKRVLGKTETTLTPARNLNHVKLSQAVADFS